MSGGFRPLHDGLPRTVKPRVVQRDRLFVRLGPEPVAQPVVSERERLEAEVRASVTAEVAAATERRVRAELAGRIAELEARLPRLDAVVEGVQTARRQAIGAAAADVADIVRLLAGRVLGATLAVNVDALKHVIEEAVASLPDDRVVCIRVAPDLVEAVKGRLEPEWRDRVQPDPAVVGGARIETETSAVDATLDAVMAGVERAMGEWLESQNPSR